MDDMILAHCRELNRCNQRGGRMLSVFDLLRAETVSLELAAFLMAEVRSGTSFLVGARPGGAGKTTVMCALLNLVAPDCRLLPATEDVVGRMQERSPLGPTCVVCHEIGQGPYFAYLWGEGLRRYCALAETGIQLATNLHADDLDEAEDQICRQNRVPAAHWNAFRLQVFLRVEGDLWNPRRWIAKVYLFRSGKHQLVHDAFGGLHFPPRAFRDLSRNRHSYDRCLGFLKTGLAEGIETIEATRRAFLRTFRVER
ncbi:MAG: hypothetical protein GXP27_02585 [Planctomycetes bacterium]|nr:hypothetical protein [Planctomycetota bacterium]